jgi:hypothetical protein
VYIPPGTLDIEPIRYCRYTMAAKVKFCVAILVIFLGGGNLIKTYLFADVGLIRKRFLISQPIKNNQVDMAELMAQEINTKVPGGAKGGSSGNNSYVPRVNSIRRSHMASTTNFGANSEIRQSNHDNSIKPKGF